MERESWSAGMDLSYQVCLGIVSRPPKCGAHMAVEYNINEKRSRNMTGVAREKSVAPFRAAQRYLGVLDKLLTS